MLLLLLLLRFLSFNFLCAAVTKQYKLVPAIAGAQVGTPRDALVPYPWSFSVSQCLSEGYRNRDQRRPMGPRSSARTVRCVTYLICFIALGSKSYVKHWSEKERWCVGVQMCRRCWMCRRLQHLRVMWTYQISLLCSVHSVWFSIVRHQPHPHSIALKCPTGDSLALWSTDDISTGSYPANFS